jgi:hypothetical protein
VAKLLAPLLYATQRGRRPLTRSGIYYLPPVNRRTSTTLPARAGLLHVVATLR